MQSLQAQGLMSPRRRGRLKPPNIPTSLDSIDYSVSHRDELRRVLDMLDTIADTTKNIVREAEEESTASPTLARVSELSRRLDDILSFPGFDIPSFTVCLETYEWILFDIRNIGANNGIANYDVLNRRLDLFIHEFEEKLDIHATERNKPESASMFQNSRNFTISGGIFNAIQVVPDAAADQSQKILRVLYIQCAFLFA